MIAIDWSHTKGLTTFDGKKVRVESRKVLLSRIAESRTEVGKSNNVFQVILEQGCPLSLCYDLVKTGVRVSLIDNKAAENYRRAKGIEKSDEADARILYELANDGAKLQPIDVSDKMIQMHDVYHQYCRYQKARVAMENMRKAHQRQYGTGESILNSQSIVAIQPVPDNEGDGESIIVMQSNSAFQPSPTGEELGTGESKPIIQSNDLFHLVPDLLPYDIAIETLGAREKSLLKRLETIAKGVPLFEWFMAGGESTATVQSKLQLHPPAIKGLGQRLWLGILVTANPSNFKCLSAYLRFCGLTDEVAKSHKYNRHARMLYHMLAEETMKQRDPKFRPIYDKVKEDIKNKHLDYTKGHIHNASLNRVATFLAKDIYKFGHTGCGAS